MIAPRNLPLDIPTLQQIVTDLLVQNQSLHNVNQSLANENQSLVAENQTLANAYQSLTNENQYLKEQLALLKAKRFGNSSEKLNKQIEELEHRIEDGETAEANDVQGDDDGNEYGEDEVSDQPTTESDLANKPAKQKPKRKPLPAHLPRTEIVIPAPTNCPSCNGTSFRKITDNITEVLEYVPASFIVMRYIRPRCACTNCEQIVQGYPPSNAIDKGKVGPGLLAHLLVQKYCNHLPFYRQVQIYEREGLELSRSSMASWAGQCVRLLEPLIAALKASVFESPEIHTDDTPVKVLAPGLGKTKTGRIWVYLRDGRPHGDLTPPAVCYFYSPDRKGERPKQHLVGFKGTVHADAYSGYDKIYQYLPPQIGRLS